jgi:glycosyltransferase involved in cell wall biosynthesis
MPAAGATPSRIAVFNTFPLLPAYTGGRQRVLRLCSGFAQWAQVDYLCNRRQRRRTEQQVAPGLTEIVLPQHWWQRRGQQLVELAVAGRAFDVAHLLFAQYNRALVAEAKRLAATADVVLFSHPYLWPALRGCVDPARQVLAYEAQNVELALKRELLGNGVVAALLLRRLREAEAELLARADVTVTVSDADADALVAEYGVDRARLVIARNGVDLSAARPWRGSATGARLSAVFVGSAYEPNERAARYIASVLAPALPDVDFVIGGLVCKSLGGLRLAPNVLLKGALPDAGKAELLAGADIALNPVTEGSGTSVKMLDFMGASLPVVSTPQGARALGAMHEQHALVCELERFPEALHVLAADPAARRRIGAAARRLVEERYGWGPIAAGLGALLQERLRARTAAAGREP